jgi:hypothetical protein
MKADFIAGSKKAAQQSVKDVLFQCVDDGCWNGIFSRSFFD